MESRTDMMTSDDADRLTRTVANQIKRPLRGLGSRPAGWPPGLKKDQRFRLMHQHPVHGAYGQGWVMSESLVIRVKRLISGSVNGVVDTQKTANDEMPMRKSNPEIERAPDDVREELARTV